VTVGYQGSPSTLDLALGPYAATLLQVEKESHVLLVTMHHIVSRWLVDGIFIRELATLYEAASTQALAPAELPIQYGGLLSGSDSG